MAKSGGLQVNLKFMTEQQFYLWKLLNYFKVKTFAEWKLFLQTQVQRYVLFGGYVVSNWYTARKICYQINVQNKLLCSLWCVLLPNFLLLLQSVMFETRRVSALDTVSSRCWTAIYSLPYVSQVRTNIVRL